MLSDIGFIPLKSSASSPLLNVNNENTNLVKAIILGGLWPRVARISMPKATFDQVASGSVQRDYVAKEIKIFDKNEGRVFLHPSSVLFGNASYKSPYLTYFSMTATSKTFLRDATEVSQGLPVFSFFFSAKYRYPPFFYPLRFRCMHCCSSEDRSRSTT